MSAVRWQQILLISFVATIMLALPAISFGANPQVTINIEQYSNLDFNSGALGTPTSLKQIVEDSLPSGSVTQPVSHLLLSCSTRPCTTTLGSFTFKDSSSTALCRIEKNDGSSLGKFELKGCIIEVPNSAASGNYFLRVVAINQPGAYAARNPGARSYSLAVNGSLRTFTGTNTTDNFARSNACANASPSSSPPTFCMRVTVTANADGTDPNGPNTVNFNPSEVASSITVDNSTSGFTSGGLGTLSLTDGEGPGFNANSAGIPCGTTGTSLSCKPVVRSDYRIVFRPGDRLRLTSSGSVGFGQDPDENFGFLAVLTEFGAETGVKDTWSAYAPGASGFYDCTPQPPLTNQTRNSTSANIPMKFDCSQATGTTPTPLPLVVRFDSSLPPGEQAALSSSGLFFTPVSARKFGDVKSLLYNYSIPSTLTDCEGGSMRVAFGLGPTPSHATEEAVFLLGSSTAPSGDPFTDFSSKCSGAVSTLSEQDLFQNTEDRTIDPSRASGSECCYPLSQVQNRNKNDFLVYVALIVDGKLDGTQVSHDQQLDVNPDPDTVPFGTANVGASISFKTRGSPTFQFFPTTVTQRACTGDLPLDGVRYRIIRGDGAEFSATPTLQAGTCTYQANVRTSDIQPNPTGPTTYTVQILINGIMRGKGTMAIFAGN